MLITSLEPPLVHVADVSGAWALTIRTDEPLQITGPGPITVTMRSSDPARHGDILFTYLDLYSDLPAGVIGWQAGENFAGSAGVTFTLDPACTFGNWSQVQSLDGDPLPTDLSGRTASFIVGVTGTLGSMLAALTLQASGSVTGARALDGGSGIDNALVAKLAADATLLGLCPHGVYWDVAPAGSTSFVIVSLVDTHDEPQLGGTAYEETLYAVEVRMVADAGKVTSIRDAADRVHTILHDQTLSVPGYHCVSMHRDTESGARMRRTEFDQSDPGVLWYRRGGYYRVVMTAARD